MDRDPFDVLGVSPDASEDEIRAAYLEQARRLHPDRHPGVGPRERERLTSAMARVNEAWEELRHPAGRERWARRRRLRDRVGADGEPTLRPPGPDECVLCGSAPAGSFRFSHQTAFVVGAVLRATEAVLCRSCARALGRVHQNRTLWQGWWGVISFFRNLGIVARNAAGLVRASRLGQPKVPEGVVGPLPFSLPEGRPVWLRSGVWLVGVVVAVLVGAVLNDPSLTTPAANETWRTGACVARDSGNVVEPVSCDRRHVGRIVGSAASPLSCPVSADAYTDDGAFVWCIDLDR